MPRYKSIGYRYSAVRRVLPKGPAQTAYSFSLLSPPAARAQPNSAGGPPRPISEYTMIGLIVAVIILIAGFAAVEFLARL